jgi:hypothetical protein
MTPDFFGELGGFVIANPGTDHCDCQARRGRRCHATFISESVLSTK